MFFYYIKLDSTRCLDFFHGYLKNLTKNYFRKLKIFFWGNFKDTILGHSQNFMDTVWIVGALGQAIWLKKNSIWIRLTLKTHDLKISIFPEFYFVQFFFFFFFLFFFAIRKHPLYLKSVNLKYITAGRLDHDMIVPPSDGPMFFLINWEYFDGTVVCWLVLRAY